MLGQREPLVALHEPAGAFQPRHDRLQHRLRPGARLPELLGRHARAFRGVVVILGKLAQSRLPASAAAARCR